MKLIYKPELDEPRGGVHPLRYSRPTARPKRGNAKDGAENLELSGVWILVGVNDIPQEDADYILKHPATPDRLRSKAFQVIEPAVKENPTGTLADFSLSDAREIIFNTYDTEVLGQLPKEDRRPEIAKWTRERAIALEKAEVAAMSGDA